MSGGAGSDSHRPDGDSIHREQPQQLNFNICVMGFVCCGVTLWLLGIGLSPEDVRCVCVCVFVCGVMWGSREGVVKIAVKVLNV